MKKRLFLVPILVIVMVFVSIALTYVQALAVSSAHSENVFGQAMAASRCKGCNCVPATCRQDTTTPPSPNPATVQCTAGPNGNGSQAWSYAQAWQAIAGNCQGVIMDTAKIAQGDVGWGKAGGCAGATFYYWSDSIYAQAQCLTNHVDLTIKGYMLITPQQCGKLQDWFTIKLWAKPNNVLFNGRADLIGAVGFTVAGSFHVADFDTGTIGNMKFAKIDTTFSVPYSGNCDSLALTLDAPGEAQFVPSITQWGVIILVCLIVVSTVFILLRRRKAVPA
jgi:hypothetical protein